MKKWQKITIGVVAAVIVCAVVGSLLGVFIPKLLNKSSINELVQEQVKPAEGQGNFLKYQTDQEITTEPYNKKLQSIEDFSKKSLNNNLGYQAVLKGLVSNYSIEFWKNYKNSASYAERFEDWNKDIDKEWNDTVDSYKKQYGDDWEFYFQLNVLDPIGGNEDDWKRSKLVEKANSSLDDYLFKNFYINPMNQAGNDVITSFPTPLTNSMQDYLVSSSLVNGKGGFGTRNNIVFQPSNNEQKLNPNALAISKFQEFVFMEWVKNELPLITSMTLWKHVDPSTINDNGYKFFNNVRAEEIYNGNFEQANQPALLDDSSSGGESGDSGSGDSGSGDSSGSTSNVGISASYKWQAFPLKQTVNDSPTGEITKNATDKYLDFSSKFNNNAWKNNFILSQTGGGINIDVKYTDDSATLYFIKLGGGSGSVFNTSYTQYAAGSNYKFNQLIGIPKDTNVPTKAMLNVDSIVPGTSGTEIMKNFMEASKPASGYYVQLPDQVKAIINDSTDAQTGYVFKGLYNGINYVTDSVDIENTPFILTRNESGVHIIGIDRAEAIYKGFQSKNYEGMINEMANTILWRYILTKSGMNGSEYLNNGFSSFDVPSEIRTYYDAHRNELLYKYITKNEATPPSNPKEYVFSSEFTTIDPKLSLLNNPYKDYIAAWIDFNEYNANINHNSTVKSKIIDLQKNANALTFKTFGNTVIQNGIAAMQPYTRNTTANAAVNRTNDGYVDDVYGIYNSLVIPYAKPKSANNPSYNLSNYQVDLAGFNNVVLKQKLDNVETQVNTLYSRLMPEIGMKKLTYSSAKYNQYLLIGAKNPTSTRYYADNIELINSAVSDWIANDSQTIKNILDIQRLLASANYDPSKSNKPATRAVNKSDVIDINNLALTGTYSSPTQMIAQAPSVPSSNANNKDFVNYYLQKSIDIVNKVSSATSSLYDYQQGLTYDQLLTLARNNWVQPLLRDVNSSGVLDFIKQVLSLKYAFDFNETTGEYEFTKFKEYLIEQTQNYKKAAFVWVKQDRNDLLKDYEKQSLDQRFAYKKYQVISNNDVNGYIYQNAPGLSQYKDPTTNNFKSTDVTFNDKASNYTVAPVKHNSTVGYTGFQGMVFEASNGGDIPSEAKTALFGNDLFVYDVKDSAAPTDTLKDVVNKGSMYNLGSIDNLIKEIENNVYSWDSLTVTCSWLNNTFGINTDSVSSLTDLSNAKNALIKLVKDNYGPNKKIPDTLFQRNEGAILATGSSKFKESSQYFGDASLVGSLRSQVVFTQFNYDDVVKLFDTNNDKILDDKDKGINWSSVAQYGFLGTSADAFFISAIQWFNTQGSYTTTAVNDANEQQGKFEAFDRRLNNLFGKDLLSNYKKEDA